MVKWGGREGLHNADGLVNVARPRVPQTRTIVSIYMRIRAAKSSPFDLYVERRILSSTIATHRLKVKQVWSADSADA